MKKIIIISIIFTFLFAFSSVVSAADSPLVIKSKNEAKTMNESVKDVYKLLKVINGGRDWKKENDVNVEYVTYLVKDVSGLNGYKAGIINFVAYGTPSTLRLPAKERAGVLLSYKETFKKLPINQAEWTDVILIANGSQPLTVNQTVEELAKKEFRTIYKHQVNMNNRNEAAAVKIIAYGVRPVKVDLEKEKKAIIQFQKIYGFKPMLNGHWNVMRAIAYSGAK
jgi:hypothetical protein